MRHSRISRWVIGSLLAAIVSTGLVIAECDVTPPTLVDFDFTPQVIDTSFTGIDVTCTMVLSDAVSGVVNPTCIFTAQPFEIRQRSCTAGAPISGTPQNGTFECTVTIPQYAENAIWLAELELRDAVGNRVTLTDNDLLAAGHPTELDAISTPSDGAGPTLTSVVFTPSPVNVDNGDQIVECIMTVADSPAGVAEATCKLRLGPPGASCTATAPAIGDRNNGVFRCDITIPQYAAGGNWRGEGILRDRAGWSTGWLQGIAGVISSTPDFVAPTLVDFSFSPEAADTGSFGVTVNCEMVVSDALAGVKVATCSFIGPGGIQVQSCSTETPFSGAPQNGTYSCSVTLPAHSEGGSWSAAVTLEDGTTNITSLDAIDLAAAGFMNELTIDCSTSVPVTGWGDDETIAWDAILGAIHYNVYRGFLSDLSAADYGDCQNARDPVLTDTTFTETDVPAPGSGYQFLVSMTDADGEGGLGTDSDHSARTVVAPCP